MGKRFAEKAKARLRLFTPKARQAMNIAPDSRNGGLEGKVFRFSQRQLDNALANRNPQPMVAEQGVWMLVEQVTNARIQSRLAMNCRLHCVYMVQIAR